MPEKEYVGSIKKCPNCGIVIESFQSKCPNCELEFNNDYLNQTVAQFADGLESIMMKRNNMVDYFEISTFSKIGKFKETQWESNDDTQQRYVENFPVPNSKEDLLEVFIFAISFINQKSETKYQITWNDIWTNKLKQIYIKSSIAMSDDQETLDYLKQLASEVGISL